MPTIRFNTNRAEDTTNIMSRVSKSEPDNSVRLAILANRLESIARRMAHTLHRTGRSGLINTARDLSCCILTASHELLTEAESLPSHVLVGPDIMSRWLVQWHPQLRRGDAFLHNSPYHGNSHAADHTVIVPVIDTAGIHRFTVFAKAHQADIGNSQPTSYFSAARDVYEEGALIFPGVQVQQDYRDKDDIIRMCKARIRVPEQWWGDYQALIGAARIGERLLLTLAEEVGWDVLEQHSSDWFDYSERQMEAALRQLPSAEATCTSTHDAFPGTPPDGVTISVRVMIDAEAARVAVDLSDNPDTLPNGMNVSEANACSAVMIGVFSALGQPVPRNAGSYRRITIALRQNCCIGLPGHPASCSLSTTNLASRIGNATQRCFANIAAGFGLAESGTIVPASMAVISGRDRRYGNRSFINSLFLMHTGGPGAPNEDAWLTTVHIGDLGLCYLDSVEIDELRYPIQVVRRGIEIDTEGAGTFCGAPAGVCEYGPTDVPIEAWFASDGSINAPLGVRGGCPGGRSAQFKRQVDGTIVTVPPCGGVVLQPGETLISHCCGGGGYGDPLDRNPERVRQDVDDGRVSLARARAVYGVIFDSVGTVDTDATAAFRLQRRGHRCAELNTVRK
jgi:N-methylhydantoinase B